MLRIRRSGRVVGSGAGSRRFARTMVTRSVLLGTLIAALVLAFAGTALALSGTPVNVGTPFLSGAPAVAVDGAGNAYIVWANTKDLSPTTTNVVQYCVLPPGATACSEAGTLVPADGGEYVDDVQVLVEGSTVVVLADVYGTAGSSSQEYEPEQEWQSTDGGATFAVVNEGKSVADGILSADTGPLNAVLVPGTNALGFGWDSAAGNETYGAVPTFDEFPLTSPPECSVKTCPTDEAFAALEPNTNPDPIGNPYGQFASQLGTNPGVLGIFETDFSNGPLECAPGFGTAYAYGSGEQSSTNSYDISPGSAHSAWKVPIAQADCNVEYPAVGGGPSGFGVLEDNTATDNVVYHSFDQAKENFDTPEVTVAAGTGELDPAVSQDGAGGVYATFLLGGAGGPISLAYSADGGAAWTGPATLKPNPEGAAGNLTSSVNATGQGWAAWTDNGSVYAQQFIASDAIPPKPTPAADTLTTSQTSGTATGASLTIPAGTIGETDRATLSGANAAIATGTVTYSLYSKSSCVATSKVFDGGTATVTAGVAAPSAGVSTAFAPGTYYWQAVYSGDANNVASVSACGSEVLTVVPATEIGGSGSSTSTTVTITITCTSPPCTVTITITVLSGGSARYGTEARKKAKHTKILTLASGTFTIKTKGPKKLTVHLTKAGKRLLARDKGHLKAKVLVSDKTPGGVETTTRTITITAAKHKHKK